MIIVSGRIFVAPDRREAFLMRAALSALGILRAEQHFDLLGQASRECQE